MEHHIERISVGAVQMENLNNVVCTNRDYLITSMLKHTDVCCLASILYPENMKSREYGH